MIFSDCVGGFFCFCCRDCWLPWLGWQSFFWSPEFSFPNTHYFTNFTDCFQVFRPGCFPIFSIFAVVKREQRVVARHGKTNKGVGGGG